MPGRPMKDYFVIPENLRRDEDALKQIAREAASYTRSLAPKSPKKKPAKKKTGKGP
jgi:hypothetical protein